MFSVNKARILRIGVQVIFYFLIIIVIIYFILFFARHYCVTKEVLNKLQTVRATENRQLLTFHIKAQDRAKPPELLNNFTEELSRRSVAAAVYRRQTADYGNQH